MFAYDATLLAAVSKTPESIAEVLEALGTIEATCADGDGLKWFSWLYLQVTQEVASLVAANGISAAAWIGKLDVEFAGFYLSALRASLSGGKAPGCWQAFFDRRQQTAVARIQFAIAGINAHINHDLPQAVAATCSATGIAPQHGTEQYIGFTALNATLDDLIDTAKTELHFRLLGDALPDVSHLNASLEAWSVAAAREAAWNNAELLSHLHDAPLLRQALEHTLDGLTALASKTLLVPVPNAAPLLQS